MCWSRPADSRPEVPGLLGADLVDRFFILAMQHTRIQLNSSRRSLLYPGDKVVVAYGNRYAPDQFEAEIPSSLDRCHLVAAGGIAARASSKHDRVKWPTTIRPEGFVVDAHGGDRFTVESRVSDPTLPEPFVNLIRITITEKVERKGGSKKQKNKGASGGGDKGTGQGITLPKVLVVRENDEKWERYNFDSDTACHVESDLIPVDGKEVVEHTFYINASNTALLTEMKYRNVDPRILEAQFKYGNVLLGLAMLHEAEVSAKGKQKADENEVPIADQIGKATRAVAPVLLPMIDQLSGIDDAEISGMFDDD